MVLCLEIGLDYLLCVSLRLCQRFSGWTVRLLKEDRRSGSSLLRCRGKGVLGGVYSFWIDGILRGVFRVVLCFASSLLFSLLFLLLLFLRCLMLEAFVPQVSLVVRLRVVFSTPSAFLWGRPSCWCFAFVASCCGRCVGLVVVYLGGNVHEPLVSLLIGEVVLGHQVVLDTIGH